MTIRRVAVWLTTLIACSAFCVAQNAANAQGASSLDVRNKRTPQLTAAAATAVVPGEDAAAETALLESINRSRKQSGVAPLRMDDTLGAAARAHALLMVAKRQLEHNFPGEPSLLQRIANVSPLPLDHAGENIAVATCANDAAEELLHSPPHRENLLNPQFNMAGIAAIWSRGHLYVVQDFAHEVPSYSAQETGKLVGNAIDDMRRSDGLPDLAELNLPNLDQAACDMAGQARPNAHLLAASYTNRQIITYTQSQPGQLPSGALRLLADPNLRHFAVGACYARNATYPTGIYWIAILLN